MTFPVVPLATSRAIGWAVVGVAGVVTYKAGKKAGLKNSDDITDIIEKPGLADRALKGAMKAFYRTHKTVGSALSKSGEKMSTMWEEVKAEETRAKA
ncbi:hypothetical protein [Desulfocicer niacini]